MRSSRIVVRTPLLLGRFVVCLGLGRHVHRRALAAPRLRIPVRRPGAAAEQRSQLAELRQRARAEGQRPPADLEERRRAMDAWARSVSWRG